MGERPGFFWKVPPGLEVLPGSWGGLLVSPVDPDPPMGASHLLNPSCTPADCVHHGALSTSFLAGVTLLGIIWNFNGFFEKLQISPKWL